jgi:ribosomal protein S4
MHLKKKYRFKLLYKKLINLKKNIQNKTKIINFKKKKWQKFMTYLETPPYVEKQIYQFYEQNCDYIPTYQHQFKWNHKNIVQCNNHFNYFYGHLLKGYLKRLIKSAKKRTKTLNKKFWVLSKVFLSSFEKRLDTILFRSHFAYSMRHAKQLISHKHVRINGKIININSYQVKNGDLIDLVPQKRFLINLYSFTYFISNFWPTPTEQFLINYRTYQIIFVENLTINSLIFPFYLNLNGIIRTYS